MFVWLFFVLFGVFIWVVFSEFFCFFVLGFLFFGFLLNGRLFLQVTACWIARAQPCVCTPRAGSKFSSTPVMSSESFQVESCSCETPPPSLCSSAGTVPLLVFCLFAFNRKLGGAKPRSVVMLGSQGNPRHPSSMAKFVPVHPGRQQCPTCFRNGLSLLIWVSVSSSAKHAIIQTHRTLFFSDKAVITSFLVITSSTP